MHVLLWIALGILAGGLARRFNRAPHWGLPGDLALGSLGAVVAGTLLEMLGLAPPLANAGHALAATFGAVASLAGMRVADRLLERRPHRAAPAPAAEAGARPLEAQVAGLGAFERRVLGRVLRRERVARDPNAAFEEQLSLGQRVADRVASFGGSWPFIGLFAAVLIAWISYNLELAPPFDPYPFILLNLVLSCLAAIQAPVIMMSQNRMASKDRIDARHDYEVNLKAEVEIMQLHAKLDELVANRWKELLVIQERQIAALERIERELAGVRGGGAPA